MQLHRPETVKKPPARATEVDVTVGRLQGGERLLLTQSYGHGADILDALRKSMRDPGPGASFSRRKAFSDAYATAASGLVVSVVGHAVALPNAQPIGFLKVLYPQTPDFYLPFAQMQHLWGAWQTYLEGVPLPVIGHRLHPFYGTYVPTRTEHLQLFATWLSQYKGERGRAIDVGTGSGVLAFQLSRAGFSRVDATDNNPNAVESVRRELKRTPAPIQVHEADLLGQLEPADLIVFNPPWTPGSVQDLIGQALYYEDISLFERFFTQAHGRLNSDGRLVVLFSTIAKLTRPDAPHPIEAELSRGRFRLVERMQRRVKPKDNRRTKERVEVWELARSVPSTEGS